MNRKDRRSQYRYANRVSTLQRHGHAVVGDVFAAHFTRQNGGITYITPASGKGSVPCPGCLWRGVA